MSTPHGPPKSNVIDFSSYTFLRARASGKTIVDSTASMVDNSLKFDFATDTCRNLYDAYKDVGDTIPRKESVESSQEQRPRATH